MLAFEFINRLKNKSFQNIADEQYTNDDRVFYINMWLNYIYRFLNSRTIRNYSAYKEIVTPDQTWRNFITTYPIQWVIKEPYSDTDVTDTWVLANVSDINWSRGIVLEKYNFFVSNVEDWYTYLPGDTWIIWIQTNKEYNNVLIKYKRWPKKLLVSNIGIEYIDLPSDLFGALMNIVMRYAMPIYLENWVNLSKAYQEQAIEDLRNYAELAWIIIDNERFTA